MYTQLRNHGRKVITNTAASAFLKLFDLKRLRIVKLVPALVLGTLLVISWQGNRNWQDQGTYARYWLAHNDLDWTPYYWIGKDRLDSNDCEGARLFLDKARERGLGYDHKAMLMLLGDCYGLRGDVQQMHAYFDAALFRPKSGP